MIASFFIFIIIFFAGNAAAQYRETAHQPLPEGVVAVSEPGSYADAETTYMLTQDISSPMTTLFVTLDLNGYTLRYADGNYENMPNSGFEEGEKGWDLSHGTAGVQV